MWFLRLLLFFVLIYILNHSSPLFITSYSVGTSPSVPMNNYNVTPIGGYGSTTSSYRSNVDGAAPTSLYASAYAGGHLSSLMSASTPHQQQQQPPAPLPPMAGARSPYAPVSYKRTPNQLPVEAPGAHEPLVSRLPTYFSTIDVFLGNINMHFTTLGQSLMRLLICCKFASLDRIEKKWNQTS